MTTPALDYRRRADPVAPLLVLAAAGVAAASLDAQVAAWAILGGLAGHSLSGSV